jgi:hypothetical protein
MGHFYVDDSIPDQAGFALAACVYTNGDLSDSVNDIFEKNSMDSRMTEFKSGANYQTNPKMASVRENLRQLFSKSCKLGLVIIPRNERKNLGSECLFGIDLFIKNNELEKLTDVFFDEGLFSSVAAAEKMVSGLNLNRFRFHFEQDSLQIKGIQLADLAAHTCSIMLKESMGFISKDGKAGENSGYDPDTAISIGFMMWASLRYNFFFQRFKKVVDDPIIDSTVDVEPYGLYISRHCSEELALEVRARFATVYLGCTH